MPPTPAQEVELDVWLAVTPDPRAYDDLAHVPALRVASVNEMLQRDVLMAFPGTDELVAGWKGAAVAVADGEASAQLVYELVQARVDSYVAARAEHPMTQADDWSRQGVRLVVEGATGRGGKLGLYYYKDDLTRWCRYRLPLRRDDNGAMWKLVRTVDGRDLEAIVEVSLSVEMA